MRTKIPEQLDLDLEAGDSVDAGTLKESNNPDWEAVMERAAEDRADSDANPYTGRNPK